MTVNHAEKKPRYNNHNQVSSRIYRNWFSYRVFPTHVSFIRSMESNIFIPPHNCHHVILPLSYPSPLLAFLYVRTSFTFTYIYQLKLTLALIYSTTYKVYNKLNLFFIFIHLLIYFSFIFLQLLPLSKWICFFCLSISFTFRRSYL